ncbi:MAG: mechanosensitive ion channel [candidate division Zixibacteria bacterium]|nr:mechanosensitive ion channel [candidate division Zixibacteria bacterium]MDE2847423.1 mechanosensitive ion channel [Gemmatimonadota bacterium]
MIDQLKDSGIQIAVWLRDTVLQVAPLLLESLLYLVVGVFVAWLIRKLVSRLLDKADRIVPYGSMKTYVKAFIQRHRVPVLLGGIAYWTVIAVVLAVVADTLGLVVVSSWLEALAGYLPRVMGAVAIVVVGFIGSIVLRDVIEMAAGSIGLDLGDNLLRFVRFLIVAVAFLLAAGQLGVDVSVISGLIMVIVGGVLLSAALAFGLGARASVSNILASHYLRKSFSEGEYVKVEGHRGRIIQMTATAVILESDEGRVVVPASVFNEQITVSGQKQNPDE